MSAGTVPSLPAWGGDEEWWGRAPLLATSLPWNTCSVELSILHDEILLKDFYVTGKGTLKVEAGHSASQPQSRHSGIDSGGGGLARCPGIQHDILLEEREKEGCGGGHQEGRRIVKRTDKEKGRWKWNVHTHKMQCYAGGLHKCYIQIYTFYKGEKKDKRPDTLSFFPPNSKTQTMSWSSV